MYKYVGYKTGSITLQPGGGCLSHLSISSRFLPEIAPQHLFVSVFSCIKDLSSNLRLFDATIKTNRENKNR